MRTTVRLSQVLIARAKKLAVERKTTLTSLIDEGLRYVLSMKSPKNASKRRTKLKIVGHDGTRPGINLDSNSALRETMDDIR